LQGITGVYRHATQTDKCAQRHITLATQRRTPLSLNHDDQPLEQIIKATSHRTLLNQ
jgi:hypothetical protein